MSRKVIIAVAPVKHPGLEMPAGCRNPQSADEVAADIGNKVKRPGFLR